MDISKTSSESVASSGDTIIYTLTLVVTGSVANTVHVSDVLPNHLIFVAMGPVTMGGTPNWNPSTKMLTWDWTSLAPGTYALTYQATVDSSVTTGTVLVNNAQLTYAGLSGTKSASVSVSLSSLYTVHIAVYNEAGELVKDLWVKERSQEIVNINFVGSPTITSVNGQVYIEYKGQQIATWDGTNSNGDPVLNGKYFVKVDNTDSAGNVMGVTQMVTVSRSIAKVTVNIYNEAGEIVRHLYSWADDPGNSTLLGVQLSSNVIEPSLVNASNGTLKITSSNGMALVWDGRSDSGVVVSNGHYSIEINYVDGKGGDQVITRGVLVESGNKSITKGNVFAGPNILKNGNTSTLVQVVSDTNFTLTARLYNTAGERVIAPVTGVPGANSVNLNLAGIASGLYFIAVDLVTPQGGLAGHQVTQIVIQH